MIPAKADEVTFETYVNNIIAAWFALSDEDMAAGRAWYGVANDIARMLGDGDAVKGAGILAALSPLKSWQVNVKLATDAAAGNVHGHFSDACRKVKAILAGADPASVLPMKLKTGNFFANIVGINDESAVTIDRHAYRVATGDRTSTDFGLGSIKRYQLLADAYREAARRLGELPKVVQAGVWVPEARNW